MEFFKGFAVKKARIDNKNCQMFKQKVRDILFEEVVVSKEVQPFETNGIELIEA